MTTRQNKYQHFSKFASKAKALFEELKDNDGRARELAKMYSFYVTTGNLNHLDDLWVSVFFGKRPVGTINQGRGFLPENGARLQYSQNVDGSVWCMVYPAKSKYKQPIDDCVIIRKYSKPEQLLSSYEIATDFSLFIRFAVWNGLDAAPTWIDKVQVNYTLLLAETSRDGEFKRHRLNKVSHWLGYVALSGVGVALIGSLLAYLTKE